MGSTGKGQVWINGESIRRYWMAYGNGGCNSYKYLEMIPLCCKVPTHGKQKVLFHYYYFISNTL
ncbi:hypothetical protein AHAS_Ahas16G0256300 [Arachis hypogaea]